MQCVITKYHPPTNTKPSRISATTASGIRKYFSYEDGIGRDANHKVSAIAMFRHLGWCRSFDTVHGIEFSSNAVVWQVDIHCMSFVYTQKD